MKWQKWARLIVASIGITAAVVVYATMGERAKPVPVTEPTRLDPKAIIESSGNVVQQVRGDRCGEEEKDDREPGQQSSEYSKAR